MSQDLLDRTAPAAAPVPAAARGGRARALLLAARLRTLPAAIAPVAVGTAAASAAGAFRPAVAAAALLGAVLIQIGTNYTNDLFDHLRGADGPDRIGPTRAVASGLLSTRAMAWAIAAAFGAATLVGVYLTAVAGWPIVAIGIASIMAGLAYTAGPFPLAYHGLGDPFVLVFFGLVAVGGTFFAQTGTVTPAVLAAGLAVGALATAILVVNNVRDREQDARAGKRTLAVRMGRRASVVYYGLLVLSAYAVVGWLARAPLGLLPLVLFPLGLRLLVTLGTRTDGPALNRALAASGGHLFGFSLLWLPGWIGGAVG